MPQPAISLDKYLSTPLPPVKENFPAGGGATGERKQYETDLKGVSIVDGFEGLVQSYVKGLPEKPLPAHPNHPFPSFITVLPKLPKEVKSAQDVQQYLKQIPLAATAASLSALSGSEEGVDFSQSTSRAKKIDAAGYESDGHEGLEEKSDAQHAQAGQGQGQGQGKSWGWKFNKSPLGSGEFLLIDEKEPDKVHLVVRTINSSAFSASDWAEFVFEGPYHYNIKSKASWYHSRNYKATKRLGCRFFVLTDYQKWVFGSFVDDHSHLTISPIQTHTSTSPTILQSLLFWSRSALSSESTYRPVAKDVSSRDAPFSEEGVKRKGSVRKGGPGGAGGAGKGVSGAAESDIEE